MPFYSHASVFCHVAFSNSLYFCAISAVFKVLVIPISFILFVMFKQFVDSCVEIVEIIHQPIELQNSVEVKNGSPCIEDCLNFSFITSMLVCC